MTQNKYFEAIDGLRAVAVLLVLFFHAGFAFARGGFVGVDVFFVISGFLITGMITRDIERDTWSIGRFYLRRIARLTPALLATIIATLIAGYFILSPEDLARLGRTGSYAAVSVSNVFFWLESGYFDQVSSSKPLLHTWSLGVEEQFYLVWPALVFLLAKLGGRKAIALGLAGLGAVSLIAALYGGGKYPGAVFFLMPFRIHQFALGGLIALLLQLKPGRTRSYAGIAAILLLIVSGNLASGDGGPYWLNAVLPAIAAAIFIWSSEATAMQTIFASSPMRWLGKRSYSIYLVHWPVMVMWPLATDFELSRTEGAIAILLSLGLGAALYSFVEKPFRFTAKKTQRERGRSLAATAFLLVAVMFAGAHLWALDGLPGRTNPAFKKYASMKNEWENRQDKLRMGVCNITEAKDAKTFDEKICATPPGDRPAYMIIGDSYASDAYLILPQAYPDVYFGQLTLPGCLLGGPDSMKFNRKWRWCANLYRKAYTIARRNGFDGVIFASNWKEKSSDLIDELASWSAQHDLDPVVMTYRPTFKERIPKIVTTSVSKAAAERRAAKAELVSHDIWANAMEDQFQEEVTIINMYKLLCAERPCPIFDEKGDLLYLDTSHLSVAGAQWTAQRIKQQHPHLFAKR